MDIDMEPLEETLQNAKSSLCLEKFIVHFYNFK